MRFLKSSFFRAILLAFAVFLYNYKLFLIYIQAYLITGWDGAGHAAVGQYFSENIFPSVWGWIPTWFAGMPFPQFYPPLWYWTVALFSHMLPSISYTTIFKSITIVLTLLIPGLISWASKRLTGSSFTAWIAGILTFAVMSSFSAPLGDAGITVESIINKGFVAQLLGFVLLIPWAVFYLNGKNNYRYTILSAILFFLIILSNVHIIPLIGCLVFSNLIFEAGFLIKNRKEGVWKEFLYRYLLIFIIPIFAASFWYFPMIYYYKYVTSVPIFHDIVAIAVDWWLITAAIAGGGIVALFKKEYKILVVALSCFLIFIPNLFHFDWYLYFLPMHTYRWVPYYFFIGIIPISYLLNFIYKSTRESVLAKILLISFSIFFLGLSLWVNLFQQNQAGIIPFSRENVAYINELADYLKGSKERVNVEVYLVNQEPESFAIDAELGKQGISTNTFILRESSLNSQFIHAIRNSFSAYSEYWGMKSYIGLNEDYTQQEMVEKIKTARLVGTKYILVRTKLFQDIIEEADLKDIKYVRNFGNWRLYEIDKVNVSEEVNFPIYFIGKLNFKQRSPFEYSIARIQEEKLFYQDFDFPVITSPNLSAQEALNKIEDGELLVNGLILSEYEYDDINRVFESLKKFSLSKSLVIVEAKDELFKKLEQLDRSKHKISILPISVVAGDDIRSSRFFLKKSFDFINENSVPSTPSAFKVDSISINKNRIDVEIDGTSDTPKPVLVKTTFFPTWERTDQKEIYLATPTFMLTYATSSFSIVFNTPKIVFAGYATSLISVLIFLLAIFFRQKISKWIGSPHESNQSS